MKAVCFVAMIASMGLPALPAAAASFDCSKAKTPFEHAICETPALSEADEILAKAFDTATGGLTETARAAMLSDQRNWLDYAQSACTDDAKPMTQGKYDADGAACLLDKFSGRADALEQSRMLGGHRFLQKSAYAALPDPDEATAPDDYWKVGAYELSYPLLDSDDPIATPFNAFVTEQAEKLSQLVKFVGGTPVEGIDGLADTTDNIDVKEVAGTGRITLTSNTYWYGHGAAHGDYNISYLHYLVPEQRQMQASDIFAGKDWEKVLADAAWTQLQQEHADRLQVEKVSDIAEIVVDPTRWDLSDIYGLVIQFQPYEVASYADGAPTITIPWEKLGDIAAENQSTVIYGQ